MAKINLSPAGKKAFALVPEGTHIFKIVSVKEEPTWRTAKLPEAQRLIKKICVTMETQNGEQHLERFTMLKDDDTVNSGALAAFSYFARTAMQDYDAEIISTDELIGRYIECVVEHDSYPSTKDPDKDVVFARLTEKHPSDGWGDEGVSNSAPFDLDDVLNT